MFRRFYFLAIALFWVGMNVLLWRAEFAGTANLGSAVPVELIWHKILTAPDDSALEILHEGKKIGYCRWRPNISEALGSGRAVGQTNAPEGQVKLLAGYTIDFEGNVTIPDFGNVRFNFHGTFGADHAWKKLTLRSTLRPWTWELRTVAGEQSVAFLAEANGEKWEHRVTYAELRQPATLLKELGLPLPPVLLLALPQFSAASNLSPGVLGLKWAAHQDWFRLGHSPVRVYRLEATLLENYRARIVLSRVGELLKIELPNGVVLINDAISPL